MEEVKGFFDYCISEKCVTDGKFNKVVKLLIEFGYKTIAINQTVNDSGQETKKKKKKGEPRDISDLVPAPLEIKHPEGCDELKILNRLTIVFSNPEIIHKIVKSPNYKKYHIIAVLPLTQSAFQFTCSNIEADLISFDPESKISYKLNRKSYNQLIDKGFYMEICYSPAITDSTKRKNTISTSHLYHSFGKSKNIIVSSGATDYFQIRSPYDVINLGLIFGLDEGQAKNAITYCGRQVYINSVGRRHKKAVMFIENIGDKENSEEQHISDDEMDTDQPAQKKTKQ